MRIGVIIPDRGDRPLFRNHCIDLISAQTLQPTEIRLVNYKPELEAKDITQRYRRGYDMLREKSLDIIAFFENDDWYSSEYLQIMVAAWIAHGKPDLFGTNYTKYFHLKERAHFQMDHDTRSSAMSTLIKPDLNFNWCPDHEPYTDTHLWMASGLRGITYTPPGIICLGIKHGVGMTGGSFHTDRMRTYKEGRATQDPDGEWLRSVVDPVSFEFYWNYFPSNAEVSPH